MAQNEWLRLTALLNELEDVPCRGTDADAWWPENAKALNSPSTAIVVRACRRCPVQSAWLDYAFARDERYGIWDAKLPEERRSMRASAATRGEGWPASLSDGR